MQGSPRFSAAALLLFPLLAAFGCSGMRTLDIDSKPPGATIFVNGERKGTTRSAVKVDFGSAPRVLIQIVKPRYKPFMQYLTEDEAEDENLKKMFTLEAE